MFERFTNRARRAVVLAQEEARRLNHGFIGTEHLLLGLIGQGGETGAAKVLESLGISLQAARSQVEEIIGQGQQPPSGHIPFTPRAKKVMELSLREAQQLGHIYIGTEHLLLGLIREGQGVAAQVLIKLGADLNRVRQQVIELCGHSGEESRTAYPAPPAERRLLEAISARVDAMEARLSVMEQRVGTAADTADLDAQIQRRRREKETAIDAHDFETAASLRNQEKELRAEKAARQQEWAAAHPSLADLAETCRQLREETERLRGLLRQHGIDPEDKTA